jgi:hypothetical protein
MLDRSHAQQREPSRGREAGAVALRKGHTRIGQRREENRSSTVMQREGCAPARRATRQLANGPIPSPARFASRGGLGCHGGTLHPAVASHSSSNEVKSGSRCTPTWGRFPGGESRREGATSAPVRLQAFLHPSRLRSPYRRILSEGRGASAPVSTGSRGGRAISCASRGRTEPPVWMRRIPRAARRRHPACRAAGCAVRLRRRPQPARAAVPPAQRHGGSSLLPAASLRIAVRPLPPAISSASRVGAEPCPRCDRQGESVTRPRRIKRRLYA